MAVTSRDLQNIDSVFSLGTSISPYLSHTYWRKNPASSYGQQLTFPSSNLDFNAFLGTSNINEWGTDPGGGK